MNSPNFETELQGSNASWKQRARRSAAKALLRFSVAGMEWIASIALWIDPTVEAELERKR
ncbi:hypothetical protein ACE10X_13100 [Bradyrhizobium sp. Pha-3]|uniref:hypothetical protein n=1 Tax=Bradyrhizobium sp. Pha-3 TaxID=208375 RepID=UPI0035D50586